MWFNKGIQNYFQIQRTMVSTVFWSTFPSTFLQLLLPLPLGPYAQFAKRAHRYNPLGVSKSIYTFTPIWGILGTSWSVISGQKIQSYFFSFDDVIRYDSYGMSHTWPKFFCFMMILNYFSNLTRNAILSSFDSWNGPLSHVFHIIQIIFLYSQPFQISPWCFSECILLTLNKFQLFILEEWLVM